MSAEPGVSRFAAERVHLLPMASSATFHWDGMGAVSRDLGSNIDSEPDLADLPVAHSVTYVSVQAQCHTSTERHARPSLTAGDLCLVPSSPPLAIDWAREAQSLTFYFDPGLLRAAARDVIASATGEFLWAHWGAHDQCTSCHLSIALCISHAMIACLRLLTLLSLSGREEGKEDSAHEFHA